jgi:hypothetical protein
VAYLSQEITNTSRFRSIDGYELVRTDEKDTSFVGLSRSGELRTLIKDEKFFFEDEGREGEEARALANWEPETQVPQLPEADDLSRF